MTKYRIVEVPEYDGRFSYLVQRRNPVRLITYFCSIFSPQKEISNEWYDIGLRPSLEYARKLRAELEGIEAVNEFNANRQVRVVE